MYLKKLFILFAFSISLNGFCETTINEKNFLERNGESIFVIGAYGLPNGMELEEAKAMGFNVVHGAKHLDQAHEYGMYVWSSFGSTIDFESGDANQKKESIRQRVAKYKDYPALLFWESMDEPAWTNKNPAKARATAEGLTKGYEFLKTLDPRPVYLNHAPRNMVETLREYNSAADMICVDIYPIIPEGLPATYAITPDGRHGDLPNQTPSCVGDYADKMKAVAEEDQPVFIVLQGFSWGATVDGAVQENYLFYPSYEESRFMAWQSIVHGVNGLMYWGLHHVPKDHEFLIHLSNVLNEVKGLSPVLLHGETLPNPKLKYYERGSTISEGIEMLCKTYEDSVYLIAVNTGIDPAAADFSDVPYFPRNGTLRVMNEDRVVSVKNGKWFDEFDGLGVHIYQYQ